MDGFLDELKGITDVGVGVEIRSISHKLESRISSFASSELALKVLLEYFKAVRNVDFRVSMSVNNQIECSELD